MRWKDVWNVAAKGRQAATLAAVRVHYTQDGRHGAAATHLRHTRTSPAVPLFACAESTHIERERCVIK